MRTTPPDRVAATLRRYFADIHPRFAPGPWRAAALFLLLLDVHAFADGNGRLARFLASRELARKGLHPILVPRPPNALLRNGLAAARAKADLRPLVNLFARLAQLGAETAQACPSR